MSDHKMFSCFFVVSLGFFPNGSRSNGVYSCWLVSAAALGQHFQLNIFALRALSWYHSIILLISSSLFMLSSLCLQFSCWKITFDCVLFIYLFAALSHSPPFRFVWCGANISINLTFSSVVKWAIVRDCDGVSGREREGGMCGCVSRGELFHSMQSQMKNKWSQKMLGECVELANDFLFYSFRLFRPLRRLSASS